MANGRTGPAPGEQRWRRALAIPGSFSFLISLADAGRDFLRGGRRAAGTRARPLAELCRALLSTAGEASGMAIARDILDRYEALDAAGRLDFFRMLAEAFNADAAAALEAAERFARSGDPASLAALSRAVEPPRQELIRRLNTAPGGTAALVRLRAQLLEVLRGEPRLELVEADLQHLLSSWFNRGFLRLVRIDWNSPASVLERLIAYESVHAIESWDDLRRRLAADRRCFAFFHPALPNDPVIFVEVALCKGLADRVQPLLDRDGPAGDPAQADSAIFYSINNCHAGLRGISFGNFLIKQVVVELQQELPQLRHFATLSPIPGFCRWLAERRAEAPAPPLGEAERAALARLDAPGGAADAAAAEDLRPLLLRLCAHYLVNAKHEAMPADPVARFHLRNGARLERIDWLGDTSPKGLRESAGMMVNYVYDPAAIVANHEAYVRDHAVAAGRAVTQLLKG
ncbi:MAG: malonyl-CoA decarboxylase [Dongiaceae bacterium]